MINPGLSANYCLAVADRIRREAQEMMDEAEALLEKAQEWEDAAIQRTN